jgi:hypothetical protein
MIVDNLVYVVIEFDKRLNEIGTSVYTNLDSALSYAYQIDSIVEIRETLLNTDSAYTIVPFTRNDGVY